MATTIVTKNGSGAPTASDLVAGELAVDLTNKRLYTEDSGGTVLELGTNPASDVTFGDNTKAIFGAGSDLQIYHDGSDSYIVDNGTGDLLIRAENNLFLKRTNSDETYFSGAVNGAVTLFHNNNAKLATTISGVDITGTVTASDMTLSDSTNPTLTITDTTTPTSLALTAGNLSTTIGTTTDHPLKFETNGTERLRIENDGSVGIGTANPNYALHVYETPANGAYSATTNMSPTARFHATESTTGAYTAIQLSANNANSALGWWNIGTVSTSSNYDNHLVFQTRTGGSTYAERMRIDANGNVGIGTDSPDTSLHISEPSTATARVRLEQTDTTLAADQAVGVIEFEQNDAAGAGVPAKFGAFAEDPNAAVGLRFYTGTGATANERMRIDSSGNLLVGKTSTGDYVTGIEMQPAGAILSYRTTNVASIFGRTNEGEITRFTSAGAIVGSIATQGGEICLMANSGGGIRVRSNMASVIPVNVSRSNLDATTDLGSSSARFKDLYLSGKTIGGDGTAGAPTYAFGNDTDMGMYRAANNNLAFSTNGGERMRIDASGNLLVGNTITPSSNNQGAGFINTGASGLVQWQAGTTTTSSVSVARFYNPNGNVGSIQLSGSATTYVTSSDQRLKDNIVDAPSASDDIDAIQVRSFDWKADGSHQKYGMVAQELQTVAPEAVSAPEDPEEMMGVDYSKLVPMLVKEIQSLRARVAQLES